MGRKTLLIINWILVVIICFGGYLQYQREGSFYSKYSCETKDQNDLTITSGSLKKAVFWDVENPYKAKFFNQLQNLKLQKGKEKLIAYYGDSQLKKKKFNHLNLDPLTFEDTVSYFQKQGIALSEEQKDSFKDKDPFIYEFGDFYIGLCAWNYIGVGACLPDQYKPFAFFHNYEERNTQEYKMFGGLLIQKKGESNRYPLFQVQNAYAYGPGILWIENSSIYVAILTPGAGSGDYMLQVYRLESRELDSDSKKNDFFPIYHGLYHYAAPGLYSGTFTEEQIDRLLLGDSVMINNQGRNGDPRILEILRKENDKELRFEEWFDANTIKTEG